MKINRITPEYLLFTILLALVMGIPTVAQAGKNHHRHDTYHYDRHDRVYAQPRQQYRRHNRHKHSHRHNYGRFNRSYNNQPHGYYGNQHRHHYKQHRHPKPRYNYGRNYSHNYNKSVPYYGYPANVVFGINTANARFMLRY